MGQEEEVKSIRRQPRPLLISLGVPEPSRPFRVVLSRGKGARPFYPMLASCEMGAVLGQGCDLGSGDSGVRLS